MPKTPTPLPSALTLRFFDPASVPPERMRQTMFDQGVRAAAGRALTELRRFTNSLTSSALAMQAAGEPDVAAALDRLAAKLKAEREAFEGMRADVLAYLQGDAVQRYRFDSTAAGMAADAEALALRHEARATEALRAASNLSATLAAAGLSEDELQAVARMRQPAGLKAEDRDRLQAAGLTAHEVSMLHAARATAAPEVAAVAEHRAAAAAAHAKAAALCGFLRDDHRSMAALPVALADELLSRHEALQRLWAAGPATTRLEPAQVTAAVAP